MITHCAFKTNTLTVPNKRKEKGLPKFYHENRGEYFKFPANIKSPVTIEDFCLLKH